MAPWAARWRATWRSQGTTSPSMTSTLVGSRTWWGAVLGGPRREGELAGEVDALSTSLPGPRQAAAAMPGPIDALPPGAICVDMTTNDRELVLELAQCAEARRGCARCAGPGSDRRRPDRQPLDLRRWLRARDREGPPLPGGPRPDHPVRAAGQRQGGQADDQSDLVHQRRRDRRGAGDGAAPSSMPSRLPSLSWVRRPSAMLPCLSNASISTA